MNAKKCDRCMAYYDTYNSKQNFDKPSGICFANVDKIGQAFTSPAYDLCPKCMGEFMHWYTGEDFEFHEQEDEE